VYIQCKPNDVQSLQSSYFLVFYQGVISKLLGQSILGLRQLPRMNILVLKKIGCVMKINNTEKVQCHFRYYRKQSIQRFAILFQ
jgi:hypothetical protein